MSSVKPVSAGAEPGQEPRDKGRKAGEKDVQDDSESGDGANQPKVWTPCTAKNISYGCPHPGKLVEASVLASVDLPKVNYPLEDSLEDQIKQGTLSRMQLEGIAYACQRHSMILPNGDRAGFFIGDSAGMGKGRQISGIMLDNILRGRSRHCWLSVSADLHHDATRDLRDIGCEVRVITSIAQLEEPDFQNLQTPAIVFSTYSGLISRGSLMSDQTRYDELLDWLCNGKPKTEYDGVIIFDEAHKAKNFREGSALSTQTGTRVHQLQKELPKARIVYSSATSVSHVEDMQYMTRLGYWGVGCPYATFGDFKTAFLGADISGMELLAVDMKTTGRAVVRNVSYEDARFRMAALALTPRHARIYRDACELWGEMHDVIMGPFKGTKSDADVDADAEEKEMQGEEGINEDDELFNDTPIPGKKRRAAGAIFWGFHQRFFAQLLLSFKVDLVVAEVKKELQSGKCAVIGLQSTGEAALARALHEDGLSTNSETDKISSVCLSIARVLLKRHFPIDSDLEPEAEPDKNGTDELDEVKVLESLEESVYPYGLTLPTADHSLIFIKIMDYAFGPTATRARDGFLKRFEKLRLPPCALDDLIDKLGGPSQVAEMTGRAVRQIRDPVSKKFKVVSRSVHNQQSKKADTLMNASKDVFAKWWADASNQTDSLNVQERSEFMRGDKLIAVISAAASTGISLHSDRQVANQRQRFHCTMELPWAADQAIQQLGRSNRTNQVNAPLFCLMTSGLGAENRFVSSVARRLQSLGALTQGDRRASVGAMSLGDLQLESSCGVDALKDMFRLSGPKVKSDALVVVPSVSWEFVVDQSKVTIDLDLKTNQNNWFCPSRKVDSKETFLAIVREALVALKMDPNAVNISGRAKNMSQKSIVTKFLNRILGLPFTHQTIVFNYFCEILKVKMADADKGFLELSGKVTRAAPPDVIYRDQLGRAVYMERLEVNTRMTFWEAIREVRYLVALGQEESKHVQRSNIPLETNLDKDFLEELLDKAELMGVQFFRKSDLADHQKRYWILCSRTFEQPNGTQSVFRPYNGYDCPPVKELRKVYRPTRDIAEIEKLWRAAYSAGISASQGIEEVHILTGSLIPVLGDILTVEMMKDQVESSSGYKLRAYVGLTNDGHRILGIRTHYPQQVGEFLHAREARENIIRLNFPSVETSRIIKRGSIDLGFEINKGGEVIHVTPYGRELNIPLGGRLIAINKDHFVPNAAVTKLSDALAYYVGNPLLARADDMPDIIALTLEIQNTTHGAMTEVVETPAPVSQLIADSIVTDPRKKRKKIEKIERKAKRLFDCESDDDILSGKKKKKSKLVTPSLTPSVGVASDTEQGKQKAESYIKKTSSGFKADDTKSSKKPCLTVVDAPDIATAIAITPAVQAKPVLNTSVITVSPDDASSPSSKSDSLSETLFGSEKTSVESVVASPPASIETAAIIRKLAFAENQVSMLSAKAPQKPKQVDEEEDDLLSYKPRFKKA